MAKGERTASDQAADAFDGTVEAAFILAVDAGAVPEALVGGLLGVCAGLIARELDAETRAELLEAFCNAFNLKVAM